MSITTLDGLLSELSEVADDMEALSRQLQEQESFDGIESPVRTMLLEYMYGPSSETTVKRCINCLKPFEAGDPWLLITDLQGGIGIGFHSACYASCTEVATVGGAEPEELPLAELAD